MSTGAANRAEERRENLAAFLASVILHLLLVLSAAWFLLRATDRTAPTPLEEEEPVRLTILPPVPEAKPNTFIDNPANENLERKPRPSAPFESNNDSLAASESPPDGAEPLPSQEGVEAPGIQLRDSPHSAGKINQPPSAAVQPQPAAEAPAEPQATPRPVEAAALLEAPKPTPQPKPTPEKTARETPPRPPSTSGYQPETHITRLRGNISNRGRASVEANATPLGRYKKQVADAIGSRWRYHVDSQAGLLDIGTVEIRFQVLPDGTVRGPRVLTNTSNDSFASVSLAAIVRAEIPPIPPELVPLLENGRLEIDYSFTILGSR